LLTFFYRQMPEIIERGHLFIAEPPLYRAKYGKQVTYLKDDRALDEYLITIALEGTQLFVNAEAPPMHGIALAELVKEYRAALARIRRIARKYHSDLLELLIDVPPVVAHMLTDRAEMQQWCQLLASKIQTQLSELQCEILLELDELQQHFLPTFKLVTHAVSSQFVLGVDFFASTDYQALVAMQQRLERLLADDAYVKRGEKTYKNSKFPNLIRWLIAEAKRGQQIQRYKGLGEMNPDQLWETTMDPAVRHMSQVKIEDAISADGIFTTLMGDNVESRRLFIESNALLAENLDV